ncbi:MAG TPA: adenylate/guanylate cyclase domain-containing protein, partial [Geobacteraceae bacterium]|nr:adenylate/guanylate cyclase domain-containing protein [Geobacteraceae bacterium]
MKCPKCQSENPVGFRYCGACGQTLGEANGPGVLSEPESERRHVTVLFTDLTGYTAMCERLDPEDVKEVMSRIFGEIAQVVTKYEGVIEKFIGDAAMALFGVPRAHEDDPVRAIKAAMEIHELVEALGPQVRAMGCRPLSMHTGIDTGLVVTGGVDAGKGATGVTGDTVNLASRLSGMGKAGEILVGPYTYRIAERYFDFEALEPTPVEGKADPVRIYRVLSRKDQPSKIHRLTGLRAELIGRKAEMAQLSEAVEKLRKGKGSIIGICGDAGTGKSRLVEEFKATLDLKEIQWREGQAYAYSQNVPYFPVTDMMKRALRIEEGDPPSKIREKVEGRIERLLGRREDIIPYIGSLFGLSYPEIEGTSPDSWKQRLHKAVQEYLSAAVRIAPTVFCLEDIHWGDPSSIELLRAILSEGRHQALFLCLYRPPFALFPSHMGGALGDRYREIRLKHLSPPDALEMTRSLLKTGDVPLELRRFVQEKAEGNPFYLEEVINTLVESDTLVRDDGSWKLSRPLRESDISPLVHGVILARLDRLEKDARRILQEASVIGRVFLYQILKRVTELKDRIDDHLDGLERLDLIRVRPLLPQLEYMFKHALTQEVVYNGLLKKDREAVHRQIAQVIEQLFSERLPEFYETLAYHYGQGGAIDKAVGYLMRSGGKSLARYALEESHESFQQAYDLLIGKSEPTEEDRRMLLDLLNAWAPVFVWRATYKNLVNLLKENEAHAASLGDKAMLGMFYSWMGLGLQCLERAKDAQQYLVKSLEIGEATGDDRIIGYACTWMSMTCSDLGLLDDALKYGRRAHEISKRIRFDPFLYLSSLRTMAIAYFFKGDCRKMDGIGRLMLEYGERQSDNRASAMGNIYIGVGYFSGGNMPSAIIPLKKGILISPDPLLSCTAKLALGGAYFLEGDVEEAEKNWVEVHKYCEDHGAGPVGALSRTALSSVFLVKGELSRGIRMEEELIGWHKENESKWRLAHHLCWLGNVYLRMAQRKGSMKFSILARNFRFIMRNILVAGRKAEEYLKESIEVATQIGAIGILGQASLGLGLLYKA